MSYWECLDCAELNQENDGIKLLCDRHSKESSKQALKTKKIKKDIYA